MKRAAVLLAALVVLLCAPAAARACGFGEAPTGCGGDSESEARYMLERVVAALRQDKARALEEFSRGEAGFRTVESYVFCVGPDGVMTAHPNPALRGQDVHELHDETGNHFIATMLKTAQPGQVSQIRYLFPRLGSTQATAKTTYYTRAGDQVCGVGVYDADDAGSSATSPAARLQQLRQRLTAGMPANLSADWAAFQQALDEQAAAEHAAFAQARAHIRAAEAALPAAGPAPTP
jgi:hypothetical protein